MRKWVTSFFLVLTMIVSSFLWPACTSNAQPTDEDIIKAIDASGTLSRADGSMSVIPPIVIVEKGKRNKDGSWPVKIKVTITYRMPDGQTSPPAQTITSFRIFRGKDNAGKSVWMAKLGS
jgi:hypothetical protein